MKPTPPLIIPFSQLGMDDLPTVGGKNASLGELYRNLAPKGVRIPDGFALTTEAFRQFMRTGGLEKRIEDMLIGLDTRNVDDLQRRGALIRASILSTPFPDAITHAIETAYATLCDKRADLDVAVRSSATAEDLPDASFAGQLESFLNIRGISQLLDACRRCFASLFTDRGISYRVDRGYGAMRIACSVGVQRMVRSDTGCAGVMFSIDTETGFRDAVLINASWGLGENVVQGTVSPDEYTVFKPTLLTGSRPILQKVMGSKEMKLVYDVGGTRAVKNVPVPAADRARFALSDDDILTLARWACLVEDHYSALRGRPTPMDMEWARDGRTGELFMVQARPETVQSRNHAQVLESFRLTEKGQVLVTGRSVGARIATGTVRHLTNPAELVKFQKGDVLVADKTDPDWEPVMKLASAVVTNRGGRTCHAAIVSRELGVPAIVGTEHATEALHDGMQVTISCAEGDVGRVYDGALKFSVDRIDLKKLERPRTQIMINIANPAEAFRLSMLPNDGVGLARMEFIINTFIRVHPMALLHRERIDEAARAEIAQLTRGYPDNAEFFVDKLAQGIGMITAAFYPRDVIIRLSDFKTNEYAHLIGGRPFEPTEENPMIGFRGASRYTHERYREGFALECRALKRVRDDMGLRNLKVMVPFCRTPDEGRRVIEEMARNGLRQGENGLEVYVMCEIPSNVVLADAFAEVFDGFSIGSNDLTQLTLGVDRDSELVAPLFDERNPAVLTLIAQVVRAARRRGRKIGICGQAPSDYPEFARFLVKEQIDSMSLNPDAVMSTTLEVLRAEREAAQQ